MFKGTRGMELIASDLKLLTVLEEIYASKVRAQESNGAIKKLREIRDVF